MPWTQGQFDEAIDALLSWSALRRSQDHLWWLGYKPDNDLREVIAELPYVVEPAREHRGDDHKINAEGREFLSTMTGRTYVHEGFVLFERSTDAAMFKLGFG